MKRTGPNTNSKQLKISWQPKRYPLFLIFPLSPLSLLYLFFSPLPRLKKMLRIHVSLYLSLVYCGLYREEFHLVKRYAGNGKLPPITLPTGTVYRKAVADGHVRSEMHRQVMKKQRLDSLSRMKVAQVSHLHE